MKSRTLHRSRYSAPLLARVAAGWHLAASISKIPIERFEHLHAGQQPFGAGSTRVEITDLTAGVDHQRSIRHAQIARAGGSNRIFLFHVCDWLVPTREILNDRGMMGDGVIDIPAIRNSVEAAGYSGLVEVEIFSTANWWKHPIAETLGICKERFASAC